MREMEKIREQLEKLLDEERQAKKDEEIVRTLQARILNEEWARRETLEKLQEEQKKMLEAERKKREEFEKAQNEKERELKGNICRISLFFHFETLISVGRIIYTIYFCSFFRGSIKS